MYTSPAKGSTGPPSPRSSFLYESEHINKDTEEEKDKIHYRLHTTLYTLCTVHDLYTVYTLCSRTAQYCKFIVIISSMSTKCLHTHASTQCITLYLANEMDHCCLNGIGCSVDFYWREANRDAISG